MRSERPAWIGGLQADGLRAAPGVPAVPLADPLGDDDLLQLRRLPGGRRELTAAEAVPVAVPDAEPALVLGTSCIPLPTGLAMRHLVPEGVVLHPVVVDVGAGALHRNRGDRDATDLFAVVEL